MDLSQRSDLTQSVHRSSGSFELVLGAVLFALVGLVIDRSAGTTPWFMVGLAIAGFAGACVSIFYRYHAAMATHAAERPATVLRANDGPGDQEGARS